MTHLHTTKRPMSEARRQHIYGELSGKFNSPALKFVGSALVIGLAVGSWALLLAVMS